MNKKVPTYERIIPTTNITPKNIVDTISNELNWGAEKLRDDILENVALEETIILTGHSLGGAIAQILGLWFEDDAYEVQIYTFGSPSVMIEQMWEDGHFRVYLENDPVPFLPPFPYVHWGIRINAETLDWDEDHPIGDVTKIDARDHSIKEYLKVLRRHNGRL